MPGLRIEAEGVAETLRAFQGLERDIRMEANSKVRAAARELAGDLATELRAAAGSSGVPVAPRVARSVKVKSDRYPTVQIGGSSRVGRHGGTAAALVWGSEQGPKGEVNHFGVPPGAGYWIKPTVERFESGRAPDRFRRAIYEIARSYGLEA